MYPAPAFDVNPNIGKAKHVLNIDDVNNRTNPATILDAAAFHGLDDNDPELVFVKFPSPV